jgi:hypothetical protein
MQKIKNETVTLYLGILSPFNACPINYNDPPIYRDEDSWQFSPKPLVVIFFRAPGGRGIYKKPLELIQKLTNPYMGWATPPTGGRSLLEGPGGGGARAPAHACLRGVGRRGAAGGRSEDFREKKKKRGAQPHRGERRRWIENLSASVTHGPHAMIFFHCNLHSSSL